MPGEESLDRRARDELEIREARERLWTQQALWNRSPCAHRVSRPGLPLGAAERLDEVRQHLVGIDAVGLRLK